MALSWDDGLAISSLKGIIPTIFLRCEVVLLPLPLPLPLAEAEYEDHLFISRIVSFNL
jgi:hypothetical protein